ncbi:MFS transporter, partial [Aeromonas caviae]|nr:MFS transporter [Aeromonas caviae]
MHKRRLPPGSGALLVLVILIALNLRPFLTAIGPLAPRIDARLALGVDTLAWVTLLPLWLIGVGVLLTPALLGRTGPRPLLGTALLLLALGSALRVDLASNSRA